MLPGGVYEVGESPLDCLKRELWEELIAKFDFDTLRFMVHQILSVKKEWFFRYGSLYHMFHDGELSINEREQEKFGELPIWLPKELLYSPVDYLHEDNRLMILQILRVQSWELQQRVNVMNIA